MVKHLVRYPIVRPSGAPNRGCPGAAAGSDSLKNALASTSQDTRNLTRSSAYTSAMFSETRYALNGDLRVAYRTSREGPRDIVYIPNWFTCCEILPELPSIQGWVEAMTSLGRLIFFDQPGTGASDPVSPGAMPTLEQWADSITGVLDDLGSREAVLLAVTGRVGTSGAVRSNTSVSHHRACRARGLCGTALGTAGTGNRPKHGSYGSG